MSTRGPIYAGGLRYHGKAPIISLMVRKGLVEVRSCNQVEAMETARAFSRRRISSTLRSLRTP